MQRCYWLVTSAAVCSVPLACNQWRCMQRSHWLVAGAAVCSTPFAVCHLNRIATY